MTKDQVEAVYNAPNPMDRILNAYQAAPDLHDTCLALFVEVERLRALLTYAADDLAWYVRSEWPEQTTAIYPSVQKRYERDMDLVYRIRAALKGPAND